MNRLLPAVLMAVLLLVTAYKVAYVEWVDGPLDRNGIVRGRDFQVFYIAGWMVQNGEGTHLYDSERLQRIQESLHPINEKNLPDFFFYPPMTALLFQPLAKLSYDHALDSWWLLQVLWLGVAGWWLLPCLTVDRDWKPAAYLALLAFYPVWDTVLHGQLAAMLLMILATGCMLQGRGRDILAGAVFSLLAIKPHYFVGIFVWLLLRRDWRSLMAMIAGLFGQLVVVAATLGPSAITAYVDYLPTCMRISQIFIFLPSVEHGLAGSIQNLLMSFGFHGDRGNVIGTLLQGLVAAWAGYLLYRITAANRAMKLAAAGSMNAKSPLPVPDVPFVPSLQEPTCAILFMFLLTPHALTYDLLLLAIPLVSLWSSSHWRWGIALYAATSIPAFTVYNTLGFSLVPVVLLAALFRLAHVDSSDVRGNGKICRCTP